MIVFLQGFDWATYTEKVMPAFARWLLERDERAIAALFEQTRCAQEESFLPAPMQRLRSWVRAQVFVQKLPRGPHSLQEYEQLCSVEEFTMLSDRYLHLHIPQLYQQNDALRTVWGAILETHCLPWRHKVLNGQTSPFPIVHETNKPDEEADAIRSELISLLHEAGLTDLARHVDEQAPHIERFDWEPTDANTFDLPDVSNATDGISETGGTDGISETNVEAQFIASAGLDSGITEDENEYAADEDDLAFATQLGGIEIGGAPDLLNLRGWLAGISLRAMVLFEYLACGRRCMPFGYVTGEPYNYAGYLTPDEVQQLAACLRNVSPPARIAATQDQQRFYQQQQQNIPVTSEHFRLVDEVLPLQANEFLQAVRTAASENLGLICGVE